MLATWSNNRVAASPESKHTGLREATSLSLKVTPVNGGHASLTEATPIQQWPHPSAWGHTCATEATVILQTIPTPRLQATLMWPRPSLLLIFKGPHLSVRDQSYLTKATLVWQIRDKWRVALLFPLFLGSNEQAKLDKKAVRETCQLILSQTLEKIYTPRRPSSPPYLLDLDEENLGSTKVSQHYPILLILHFRAKILKFKMIDKQSLCCMISV